MRISEVHPAAARAVLRIPTQDGVRTRPNWEVLVVAAAGRVVKAAVAAVVTVAAVVKVVVEEGAVVAAMVKAAVEARVVAAEVMAGADASAVGATETAVATMVLEVVKVMEEAAPLEGAAMVKAEVE